MIEATLLKSHFHSMTTSPPQHLCNTAETPGHGDKVNRPLGRRAAQDMYNSVQSSTQSISLTAVTRANLPTRRIRAARQRQRKSQEKLSPEDIVRPNVNIQTECVAKPGALKPL